MESIRVPYKKDDYGNDLFARVSWSKENNGPKPIGRHRIRTFSMQGTDLALALVYHGGGLMVGSSEMIPKPQTEYLASKNFVVVIPNYRLAPQVTAEDAFGDCEEAYEWATAKLPDILKSEHAIQVDASKVAAYGHSSGGTIALHMASSKPLRAATAFYPSLFGADPSSALGKPTSAPPFGMMPDFEPTADDWADISPEGKQVSEAPLAFPGTVPRPRNKWQMSTLKNGKWNDVVLPDGDLAAIDPMTRISKDWAPTMIVQGELDNLPGSGLDLAQRAEKELKAAGVKGVQLEVVAGESHMFDLPPMVGTSDLGPKWQAVVKGLDWLVSHV